MHNQSTEVRFSDYTILGPLPEDGDSFIAVNTMNDSVALIGRETVDAIRQGATENISSSEIQELLESSIIVPRQKNETYSLQYTIQKMLRPDQGSYVFQVHPTMACNLACEYCYAWRTKTETMSENTAVKVTDWIKEQIELRNLQKCGLIFCGGEPLLHSSIVLQMSREISSLCKTLNADYSTFIVTNGVMLAKDFVEQLLDDTSAFKVTAQVTLDGPKSMHNARRRAKDGSSSFNAIIENLYELNDLDSEQKKRIEVVIRVNVDYQNIDSIPNLAQQLRPMIGNGIVGRAYLAQTDKQHTSHDQHVIPKEEWLAKVSPLWYQIADQFGLDMADQRKMTPCVAYREIGITIAPDGTLYSCQCNIGDSDLAFGHIDTGVDINKFHEQYGLMPWNECIGKCPVLTWCWGGCRAQAKNYSGDWKALHCRKNDLITENLAYYRFKHRERIAKWLYNRANGIEEDKYADYKEIAASQA